MKEARYKGTGFVCTWGAPFFTKTVYVASVCCSDNAFACAGNSATSQGVKVFRCYGLTALRYSGIQVLRHYGMNELRNDSVNSLRELRHEGIQV